MSGTRRSRHLSPAQQRRRRVGRVVIGVGLALTLVGGVVYGGLGLLSGLGAASSTPEFTAAPPLLPGAPVVVVPPRQPAATVAGVGYDISYPQCGRTPPRRAAFGIVGLNGGAPLMSNSCFAEQVAWARSTQAAAVYINTSWSGHGDPVAYGQALVDDAIERERKAGVKGVAMWWLDVEIANTWNGSPQENATVLDAMAARLQGAGVRVGIYSSPAMWQEIAGDWAPGLPVWNAKGPGTRASATAACPESFAGSSSAIVQWVQTSGTRLLDHNLLCPAWRDRAGDVLDVTGS